MLTPEWITTERLTLRLPSPADVDPLSGLYDDPVALAHAGTTAVWGKEQTRDRLEQWNAAYQQHGHTIYTVVLQESGTIVGLCGLAPIPGGPPDLACMLARPFWRHGYAREASRAILSLAQASPQPQSLTIHMEPDHPSLSAMERTIFFPHGFTYEGQRLYPRSSKVMRFYRWSPSGPQAVST
ncbi:GNAT family N-acetyltransferase [Streptomyces sp. NPDC088251]|uniref:GNAT family N-acetyltransferase n=1 Tax=unclassified Streptomyces TaxID=2593676 RepID=UPI00380E6F63